MSFLDDLIGEWRAADDGTRLHEWTGRKLAERAGLVLDDPQPSWTDCGPVKVSYIIVAAGTG